MFENKKTHGGIYYTRYIASWKIAGGRIYRGGLFERWLREDQKLTEEEIHDILEIAECGKLELQESAKAFMDNNKGTNQEERKLASLEDDGFNECTGKHYVHIKALADRKYRSCIKALMDIVSKK